MFQGGGGLQGRSFVFKQFTNYECADSVITEAIWQRFPATLDCVSEGATMGKRLLTTMLALLLISAPAAARVKAKAVATRQVAQDTVRTPPQPAPKPIAPLPVLLVILAGVVATAFVSFAKALSPAREAGEKAEIRAHASAHSPSARSVGVATVGIAVAQSFQVDAHQFGKARLVSLP